VSCSGYPDLTPFKLTAYADDVTVVVSNVDDIDINNTISLKSDICTYKLGEMYNIIDGRMERKWTSSVTSAVSVDSRWSLGFT